MVFLRLQTWVDLRSDLADPTQLHLLLTGLRGHPPAEGSTLREALCPYRGLLPFREEDAGLFFGREEAIDILLGKLRDHNLVTLVGRSGSGKSSVVFAGLIPALRRRVDGRTWFILSLRPGSEPLHALVRLFSPPPRRPAPTGSCCMSTSGRNSTARPCTTRRLNPSWPSATSLNS
jgi:hypothetical protein